MSNELIETYYETVILPQYRDDSIAVAKWVDHGKVGPDAWAHYFEDPAGVEYVLVNEDFPDGAYLGDDLTHDLVPVPGSEDGSLRVTFGDSWIPNVSGFFTLYKERAR